MAAVRLLLVLLLGGSVACSSSGSEPESAGSTSGNGSSDSAASAGSGAAGGIGQSSVSSSAVGSGGDGTGSGGAGGDSAGAGGDGGIGAGGAGGSFDGVIDVTIFVANTCEVTTTPATISVPAGTEFKVNWIHSAASQSNADVDKIDQFNQVPLIIDFEPGMSYFDSVHPWCGIFTGTFSFRVTGCFEPGYLDVDCDG